MENIGYRDNNSHINLLAPKKGEGKKGKQEKGGGKEEGKRGKEKKGREKKGENMTEDVKTKLMIKSSERMKMKQKLRAEVAFL